MLDSDKLFSRQVCISTFEGLNIAVMQVKPRQTQRFCRVAVLFLLPLVALAECQKSCCSTTFSCPSTCETCTRSCTCYAGCAWWRGPWAFSCPEGGKSELAIADIALAKKASCLTSTPTNCRYECSTDQRCASRICFANAECQLRKMRGSVLWQRLLAKVSAG